MNTTMILVIAHIGFILWFAAGYSYGKYRERVRWNELITKGILPKPKNTTVGSGK